MKKYEGLFVFAQPLDEQALDEKLDRAKAEITRLGGTVDKVTRLGRQTFARRLHKKDAGFFALFTFFLDPSKVSPLRDRFGLSEDVFRVQLTVAPPPRPSGKDAKDEPAKPA